MFLPISDSSKKTLDEKFFEYLLILRSPYVTIVLELIASSWEIYEKCVSWCILYFSIYEQ